MENIFQDLFNSIFGDSPLDVSEPSKTGGKSEIKIKLELPKGKSKDKSEEKKESVVKRLIPFVKKQHVYESDNLKGIDKQMDKKGYVEVSPRSKRYTDDDVKSDKKKLSLDEYDGKNTVEIDSTAVGEPIRYNEKTGEVWLRFKDKNGKPTGKWYHYTNMDKEQFKSFMKASSKGRYVNFIMKYKNHDPAYGPAPKRKKK